MSIIADKEHGLFTLLTDDTAYQMQIGPLGYLLHNYYGPRCEDDFSYLHLERDCGFSPNPYDLADGRGFSLDTMPQEYSGSNSGDYRLPSVLLHTDKGVIGADFHYVRHEIKTEKYALEGLPSAFAADQKPAETLSVTLRDEASGLEAELLYGVFERENMITRAVKLKNKSECPMTLEKAASGCLDLPFGSWDGIQFHGRHVMERQPERMPLVHGIQTVSSERGASSHQHNPFVILCEHNANEDYGNCYGVMLCYSGSHQTEVELDQTGSVRIVSGIGGRYFSWKLMPGEVFETPEMFLCFSHSGLTALSQAFHAFIRGNLCRSTWTFKKRPVLFNSWEAAYLDFNEEKILTLAKDAKALGAELLVLDDGWFGARDNDSCALGDWFINTRKLPNGLDGLIRQVNEIGLKFGLWIEPEMISEDSQLYRAHPDWALQIPGRKPAIGRNQMVLDLSRPDVTDWLFETFSALLRENNIEYIKWDMNRSLSDVYSSMLPPERQGEVLHRYMLGLYSFIERLTSSFPQVLFEGCAGGGGRFDAGMLAYFPQIWCSDNTDAIARLKIQEGTSFGYPCSAVGAHVSASPNHQTGRESAIGTRAIVAMAGTFGYELDPAKLSNDDREDIRRQIIRFHEVENLVREGRYYRLTQADDPFTAWQFVSDDKSESLLSLVLTRVEGNPIPLHLRLKGLLPDAKYRIVWKLYEGCSFKTEDRLPSGLSGVALMAGGITLPRIYGNYPSVQILLRRES